QRHRGAEKNKNSSQYEITATLHHYYLLFPVPCPLSPTLPLPSPLSSPPVSPIVPFALARSIARQSIAAAHSSRSTRPTASADLSPSPAPSRPDHPSRLDQPPG